MQDIISCVDSKMSGGSCSGEVGIGRTAWAVAHHGELAREGGSGAAKDGLRCGLCQNKKESSENLT
jgi:hypothetical protein